jgi:arabinofuranan 3-O-arabinosyltransferase
VTRRLTRGAVDAVRRNPMTTAAVVALVAISFLQRPGRVTFDTKLDLAVNPAGLMARSLHLWNPMATSGELQNQAYGYLFPMGPFFAAGQALGLPMWITQRLWCALVLCLAFGGALLVARALRVGSPTTRHLGALAYALAPRMLTEIGPVSAEMLPAALLPWVLLPLVRIGPRSPRRAAALSGLAVLCMGGVNAAIVVTVLVLPGLWLLTRPVTRRQVLLIAWWLVAVTASVLWWMLPLVLLGRYSLPFLTYIESAANTTGIVSLFQATRGTNQWVAYVVEGEPWWPAGFMLVDNPVLMVATMALAAIGLAGLAARGLPERRFLVLGMLAGLTLITVGFVGALDSPLSGLARDLLDGPLAPLRNIHKFEPVLRLPVILGLMHALTRVPAGRPWFERLAATPRQLARGAVVVLILVVAAPAWVIALRPGPGWSDLPGYWRQAATWLEAQDRDARTLLVPGTGFGQYLWGRTVDEPIQPLAGAPWAMRTQVPLGSEGNTRVMDTVEEVLAGGRGSAGLAGYLARNGYRYLMLRNDIDRSRPEIPPVTVIRQAIARSPGLRLAAEFGPQLAPPDTARSPVDDGEQPPRVIEIYAVEAPLPLVRAVPTAQVATVSGGPESLLPLLEQGVIDAGRPALLAGDRYTGRDELAVGGPWLVTDGLRRRERNVGRVRDNVSQTLTAAESPRQDRATLDILPFPGDEHQTTAVYQGVRAVTASTAASFADAPTGTEPSRLPFAAIDDDPATAWVSASLDGPAGQWLEVSLDTPRRIPEVRVRFVDDVRVGWRVARFRVTTDRGSIDHDVTPGAEGVYPAPDGLTTTVRITVLSVAGDRTNGNVGIHELGLGGLDTSRALRVPVDQGDASAPPSYVFTRGHYPRASCYPAANEGNAVRCDPQLARTGEEAHGVDRLFRTPLAARYGLTVTAVPRPGAVPPLVPALLEATASSWLGGDPRVSPLAAIDGDPTTAWLADVGDTTPTLRLNWPDERTLDQISVRFPGRPIGSRPVKLELRTPTGSRFVDLRADGSASFDPIRTAQVDIVVVSFDQRVVDRRGNRSQATPGFAEVDLPTLRGLRPPFGDATKLDVPCGRGPVVELDGVRFQTAISGTLGDFVSRRPLPVTICDLFAADALDLPAGEHRLHSEPSAAFLIQDAALKPVQAAPGGSAGAAAAARATTVEAWAATDRSIRVAAGAESLLVIAENANSGWRATLDGRPLRATRIDGWQQAWVVPEGAGGLVRLTFTPDRPYRQGLAIGAGAALLVVLLAVVPPLHRRDPAAAPAVRPPTSRAARYVFTAAVIGLVAALSGVLAVVLLIAGALVRQVYPRALTWIVLGGAGVATAVAVAGRLSGHGQGWAYGHVAQAAMLAAVCAGVAAAAVTVPGSPDLDEEAGQHEEAGDGPGGDGDAGHRPAEPPADERDLDEHPEPDRDDRPHVTGGEAGEQQQLPNGKKHPGEREQPERGGLPAVSGTTDERQ